MSDDRLAKAYGEAEETSAAREMRDMLISGGANVSQEERSDLRRNIERFRDVPGAETVTAMSRISMGYAESVAAAEERLSAREND